MLAICNTAKVALTFTCLLFAISPKWLNIHMHAVCNIAKVAKHTKSCSLQYRLSGLNYLSLLLQLHQNGKTFTFILFAISPKWLNIHMRVIYNIAKVAKQLQACCLQYRSNVLTFTCLLFAISLKWLNIHMLVVCNTAKVTKHSHPWSLQHLQSGLTFTCMRFAISLI